MISPVVLPGRRHKSVYFPDARWYDITGWLRNGGIREVPANHRLSRKLVRAPLEVIPLHVRGGVVFPLQSEIGRNTQDTRRNPRSLLVALDDYQEAEGKLYDDDGESIAGSTGDGQKLLVNYWAKKGRVEAKVLASTWRPEGAGAYLHSIDIVGVRAKRVAKVSINGHAVAHSFDGGWLRVRGLSQDVGEDFTLEYH